MSTVRKTRSGSQYLVYVTVLRLRCISTPARERESEQIRVNGHNTTGGLAYNHPTRCLTSYGDVAVGWFASRQPQPAP